MTKKITTKKLLLVLSITIATSPFSMANSPSHSIEIKRDTYGVPHIYADTTYDLFYGYGYAVAEDRLFQMDMARRSFTGTTAEVLGRGDQDKYLKHDINTRQNYFENSIQKQLEALNLEDRSIFQGYADGFNAYIARIEGDPDLLPLQYSSLGFSPIPFSDFDVLMIWVGSMANRFSDVNLEITNLSLLNDLISQHGKELGMKVFNEVRWVSDSSSPTTARKASPINDQVNDNNKLNLELKAHSSMLTFKEFERQHLSWGGTGVDAVPKTSNIWITAPTKTSNQSTVLINGPQFGWYNPSYVYGVGLHGAGYNVVGNTPFAYPVILFATNGVTSWGSTAGPQDVVDIYQEQLNPNDPHEYLYNGVYQPMISRNANIKIKDEPTQSFTFWSTIHGPVTSFDLENDIAYSKKRSWDGHEVQSLLAWIKSMKSQNWNDFQEEAKKVAISINWYYADNQGDIGYISAGFLPNRPSHQDTRVPAIGDGTMEWLGILDFSQSPKSYNPEQGFILNWNNLPAPDKTNTDAYYWTYADRVNELYALYDEKDTFSPKELWEFNKVASYTDVNYRYFKEYLEELLNYSTLIKSEAETKMLEQLLSWNGVYSDEDQDYYDDHTGPLIFETWLQELYRITLLKWLPETYHDQYLNTGFSRSDVQNPGSVNLSMGSKIILRQLASLNSGPEVSVSFDLFEGESPLVPMNKALISTYKILNAKFGGDMTQWKSPVSITTFSENNFTGIPQGLKEERLIIKDYQNRGTENNRVIFTSEGVEFCDVVAPGQSGFVSANETKSAHYDDQIDLYFDFNCKPQYLSKEKVEPTIKSTVKLSP